MSKIRLSQRSNNSTIKSSLHGLPDDPNHWARNIIETSFSLANDCYIDSHLIRGGAENGEMCWVGELEEDEWLTFHDESSRFKSGDIFLEVENQSVVGFTTYDLIRWLKIITKKGNTVIVRHVSPDFLTKDLRTYLNTRFLKGSIDHELQHTIRLNIYRRTVPCTTRPIRDGEVDKVDYDFLTVDEFKSLAERGCLLESGTYDGNFYGTPLPPQQEDVNFTDDSSTMTQRDTSEQVFEGRAVPNLPSARNGEVGEVKMMMHPPMKGLSISKTTASTASATDEGRSYSDDDLPPGWERVDSYPECGVFYVDHVNKRTQYEHPGKAAKKPEKLNDPKELKGQLVTTCLVKGPKGLGFTIIGGDETNDLLQVKTILHGGPAHLDQVLKKGDVLVEVDGRRALGLTHRDIISLFQDIPMGAPVKITVCRGYPLTFDPDDPNNEVIQTMAVQPPSRGKVLKSDRHEDGGGARAPLAVNGISSSGFPGREGSAAYPSGGGLNWSESSNLSPFVPVSEARKSSPNLEVNTDTVQRVKLKLARGADGFRFTITDVPPGNPHVQGGQRVRAVMDRTRCGELRENDIIEKINDISVLKMSHTQVVEILKACPIGKDTEFVVLRGVLISNRSSSVTPSGDIGSYKHSPNSDEGLYSRVMKPNWKQASNNNDGLLETKNQQQTRHLLQHQLQPQQKWSQQQPAPGRSKTPGPILMTNSDFRESKDPHWGAQQQSNQLHSRSKSSSRLFSGDIGYRMIPDGKSSFSPASQYVDAKYLVNLTKPLEGNYSESSVLSHDGSRNSSVATNRGSFYSQAEALVAAGAVPAVYSSSSSASATPVLGAVKQQVESDTEEFHTFPVRLFCHPDGFGFRLVGGREEGLPVSVGYIVPGGSADADGRMEVGDEIVAVNSEPVLGSTCKDVSDVVLATASACGFVNLELRRQPRSRVPTPTNGMKPLEVSLPPPYSAETHLLPLRPQHQQQLASSSGRSSTNPMVQRPPLMLQPPLPLLQFREVTLVKQEQQSFGFTIISTSARLGSRICSILPNSPADLCDQLSVDDLILTINGIDVTRMIHEEIVELIRASGTRVTLTVTSPPSPSSSSSANTTPAGPERGAGSSPVFSEGSDKSHFFGKKSFDGDSNNHTLSFPDERSRLKKLSPTYSNNDQHNNYYSIPNKVAIPMSSNSNSTRGFPPPSKFHFVEISRGPSGFGFTISGGREFGGVPLTVLKIADGGAAAIDGKLKTGDEIVEINDQNTGGMTHAEAIRAVQSNPRKVTLLVKRQPGFS